MRMWRQSSASSMRSRSRSRTIIIPASGVPTIILSGSEDGAHASAFALKPRIPGCEMHVLYGAGHACQIEQPWLFNKFMLQFLMRHALFPEGPKPVFARG